MTAAARAAVVRVCRRLWERGLIAGPDGNVSVRLAPDRLLVTPPGRSKVDVTADALVEVDLDGRVLTPGGRATTELAMHLAIYRARPDVGAVVHAHPPTATGFAVAGETLPDGVLPELICQVGAVALVPYFTPGTPAAADAFAPYFASHDAFLLANHGATVAGPTLEAAHQRMESLEHAARILLAARLVGRVTPLTPGQRAALQAPAAPAAAPTVPPPEGGEAG
ncbi:class II aldolase/adducin family protein [Roseisolibacter sp. H3M3-2]|uniref:class II aldolase/adducin family protein n=1 Tax=Roseisolibacter sp. H3M3-2 TaxID=3031323 RepID=UPI0023DBFD04|nr:class II aldolase/adducin family protein [Roseisolibacter sp. H3M3-2]MDF1502251.1 class II aldolase/adducin family protein [Roseisolibacter sp. H3M3-2]